MSALLRAHLALLVVNLIYGVNYMVAKGLMPDLIQPSGFIFLRVAGASVLFWLLMLTRKFEKVAPKDLLLLAICSFFGVAGNQLMFFHGLNLTSPINASIIMTANPILVLVLAAVFLKERISGIRLSGIIAGAIGAVWLIASSADGSAVSGDWRGDIMILVNAALYAVFLVMVKPLMKKYNAVTVSSWVFLFGIFFVLPFGWTEFREINWPAFSTGDYISVVFVVVGTTFLAYLMSIYAIRIVSANVVSSYTYFQPAMAAVSASAFVWLGWADVDFTGGITISKVLSSLLIFLGVYLVSKPGLDKAREKSRQP